MLARKAQISEKNAVISFYEDICRQLSGARYTPCWEVGVYPTYEELEEDLENGRIHIGFEDNEIACAAVISIGEDPIYAEHQWKHQTDDRKIGIIHLLAVSSNYRGKGTSGEFLIYLLTQMRMMGLEVCHLDALGENLPAVKFYEKFGFETSGRSIVHYEDLGDVEVYMFEYDLKKISC